MGSNRRWKGLKNYVTDNLHSSPNTTGMTISKNEQRMRGV